MLVIQFISRKRISYNFIFIFLGNVNEDFDFEYGIGTQAHQGCGVTFQNEFWYFGGNSPNKRQVSYL